MLIAPVQKQIYNGDKVDVALTGSNTGTYTFSVCYVSKTEVCLICDADSLPNGYTTVKGSTLKNYSWGYSLTLPNGKSYSGICKQLNTDIFGKKCHIIPIIPKSNVSGVNSPATFAVEEGAAVNSTHHLFIRFGLDQTKDPYYPGRIWIESYALNGLDSIGAYGMFPWPAIDIIL